MRQCFLEIGCNYVLKVDRFSWENMLMHLLQHILDSGLEAKEIKGFCPFVQQSMYHLKHLGDVSFLLHYA